MTGLDLQLERLLMKVTLSPSLLQLLDLMVLQLPANKVLELLLADRLVCLLLLRDPILRLEARLHADAERGVERNRFGVTAYILPAGLGVVEREESVARGLEGEGGWVVGYGDRGEGFGGRDGGRVCA